MRFVTEQNNKSDIPGKPIFIGEQKQNNIEINLIAFNDDKFIEIEINEIENILKYASKYKNVWVNVDGIHDVESIKKICEMFNIHTLLIEDIVNTGSRTKSDIEEDYIFTIIKMMFLTKDETLHAEQLSMFLTNNVLLTFQEKKGDVFDPVRDRIRNKKGRIRSNNLSYLKYCLLDVIVNNYNFLVETFGKNVENLEDQILSNPNKDTLKDINKNKIELNYFKKSIRPAREAISNFKNYKTPLITKKEQLFYNDLNDLISRVYDTLENYKNMLSEQLTVYSTNVNYKLNEIMKLLTIFSVIFIPITFIVGVYGTNFNNIPEIKLENGYFLMWGIIILVTTLMLIFFKKKKWF